MARDRVVVALGRTIALANYESLRVDVGLEADVREGETRQQRFEKLMKEAEGQLDSYCAPIEADIAKYNLRRKGK